MSYCSSTTHNNGNSFSVADAMKFFVPIGPSIDATIVEGMKIFQMLDSTEKSEDSTNEVSIENITTRLSSTKSATNSSFYSPSRSHYSRDKDNQDKLSKIAGKYSGKGERKNPQNPVQGKHGKDYDKRGLAPSSASSVSAGMQSDGDSSSEARISASAANIQGNKKHTSGKTLMHSAPFKKNHFPPGSGSSGEGNHNPARQSSLQKYRHQSQSKSNAIRNSNYQKKQSSASFAVETTKTQEIKGRNKEWQDRHGIKHDQVFRKDKDTKRELPRVMKEDPRKTNVSKTKQENLASGRSDHKNERTRNEQDDRLVKGKGQTQESNGNRPKTMGTHNGKGGEDGQADYLVEQYTSSSDNLKGKFSIQGSKMQGSDDRHRTKNYRETREPAPAKSFRQPLQGKISQGKEDSQNRIIGNQETKTNKERSSERRTGTGEVKVETSSRAQQEDVNGLGSRWPLQEEIRKRLSGAEVQRSDKVGKNDADEFGGRHAHEVTQEKAQVDRKRDDKDKKKEEQDSTSIRHGDGKGKVINKGYQKTLQESRMESKTSHESYQHKQEWNSRNQWHETQHQSDDAEENANDSANNPKSCPLYFDVDEETLSSTSMKDNDITKSGQTEVKISKGRKKIKVMWAATKVTFFSDDTRMYEVMKMSNNAPYDLPTAEVDGIFVMAPPAIKTIKNS